MFQFIYAKKTKVKFFDRYSGYLKKRILVGYYFYNFVNKMKSLEIDGFITRILNFASIKDIPNTRHMKIKKA